jgi:hypothetical protein
MADRIDPGWRLGTTTKACRHIPVATVMLERYIGAMNWRRQMKLLLTLTAAGVMALVGTQVNAAPSAADAARLGKTLTPLPANYFTADALATRGVQ